MITSRKIFLFDWGNTIMKDFPDETGPMFTWQKVEAMPGVDALLQKLSKAADCYIATNAKDSEKENIIKALQRVYVSQYFMDVFCFREIGHSKPSKEYFDYIVDKLKVQKENMVMVGDNLESDILGAQAQGIDSILYASEDKYPEYDGARVSNLLSILEIAG